MTSISVYEDRAVLDLVAHFLGIATHDNINAAPSGWERAPREHRDPTTAETATAASNPVAFHGPPERCDHEDTAEKKRVP